MRIYKPRGLNIDESYACSRTAVRNCFGEWDISVFWGEPEGYNFDRSIKKPPKIDGCVVASIRLDLRRRALLAMNFYVIRNSAYGKDQQAFFEQKVLPRMHDWLSSKRENHSSGKMDEMLVIWKDGSFFTQEIRLA